VSEAPEVFAARAHAGQVRRGPARAPYLTHCAEVVEIVARHGGDGVAVAAAWLHDTVEDTDATLEEIEARFGAAVAGVVAELTDPPGLSREARFASQIAAAPGKSARAALVKAADQTSNLRGLVASPPDWPADRRAAYVAKARAVVAGLAIPDALRAEFEAAAARAEAGG